MKLIAKYPKLFFQLTVYFSTIIRLVLNVLLVIICAALIVGVYKAGDGLLHSLHQSLDYILQQMLLDIVFIVALVEVSITILGYLKDGSVHVRYIVDTVLIIMLNEVVSLWFKKPNLQQAIGIGVILAILAGVRICVTRFAPKERD